MEHGNIVPSDAAELFPIGWNLMELPYFQFSTSFQVSRSCVSFLLRAHRMLKTERGTEYGQTTEIGTQTLHEAAEYARCDVNGGCSRDRAVCLPASIPTGGAVLMASCVYVAGRVVLEHGEHPGGSV